MRISDFITDKFQYNWDFIETVPEFARLKECEQNPRWHKEGSAWEHTRRVCIAAQNMLLSESVKRPSYQKRIFLAAALFHDIGKGVTTKIGKDGNWHSYGHEFDGEKITRLILWDENWCDREEVCALVRLHMEPSFLFDKKNYLEKMVEFSKKTNVEWLIDLKTCDLLGSEQEDEEFKNLEFSKLEELKKIACSIKFHNIDLISKMPWSAKKRYGGENHTDVYVMVGLPGAGKGSIISSVAEREGISDYVIISRDRIKEELGFENGASLTNEQIEEVTRVFNSKLKSDVVNGKSAVFIDGTNMKLKYRYDYKTLLNGLPVRWIYVYVEAPGIKENIARCGNLTEEGLKSMILNIDWPSADEYDLMQIEITGRYENN